MATTTRVHVLVPLLKGNQGVQELTGELAMAFQDHDRMVMLIEVVIRPIEPVSQPRDISKVFTESRERLFDDVTTIHFRSTVRNLYFRRILPAT